MAEKTYKLTLNQVRQLMLLCIAAAAGDNLVALTQMRERCDPIVLNLFDLTSQDVVEFAIPLVVKEATE